MHVAERQLHHLLDNLDGVLGCFGETESDDGIHSTGMAVVADIVALDAACLAVLFLVAYRALHEFIRFQILQGRLANQTFFFHCISNMGLSYIISAICSIRMSVLLKCMSS